MKKIILAALMFVGAYSANAQVDLGADIVSDYVWRGSSYGSLAIQPYVSKTVGSVEIGAWGSFSANGIASEAELDLYATVPIGPVSATLTHYTFPGADDYSPFDAAGLEVSLGGEIGGVALTAAYFTDAEDMYFEAGYALGSFDLAIGAGDNAYTTDGEFALCNISLGYSNDSLFGNLVYNPDADAMFMVVGISL